MELTIRKASPIVACLDEDLSVTPKQTSSSLGGKSGGGLLSMMKGRRGSQEGMDRDTLKELESRGLSSLLVLFLGCMSYRGNY